MRDFWEKRSAQFTIHRNARNSLSICFDFTLLAHRRGTERELSPLTVDAETRFICIPSIVSTVSFPFDHSRTMPDVKSACADLRHGQIPKCPNNVVPQIR